MAKYLLLFSFTGEMVRRFVAKPSDRADGAGVVEMPDSHTMAAVSLAAASSGAFTHLETHELIDARNLAGIAERAKQIAYQPPGA